MNISTTCDSIDSITRIHFLDLMLRFLKFKEKLVNLHQMLHLVYDGFFDICFLDRDMEQLICTIFTFITALFSVKG